MQEKLKQHLVSLASDVGIMTAIDVKRARALLSAVQSQTERLQMYNVMLRKCSDIYGQPRWSSWTELERAIQVDPASIVKCALESDSFDLARQ